MKNSLRYVDTAIAIEPTNLLATPGLVRAKFAAGSPASESGYVPPLDNLSPPRINPPKQFRDWWETPVTKDSHGNLFNRQVYVLTVAN